MSPPSPVPTAPLQEVQQAVHIVVDHVSPLNDRTGVLSYSICEIVVGVPKRLPGMNLGDICTTDSHSLPQSQSCTLHLLRNGEGCHAATVPDSAACTVDWQVSLGL